MTGSKTPTSADNLPVPASKADAAEQLAQIGTLRRAIDARKGKADNQIAAITAEVDRSLEADRERLGALEQGLVKFCQDNRDELTQGGKTKTVKFASGRVSFRNRPMSVSVRKAADVIARLRALKLDRFIRIKEEVNKDAMREEADVASAVDGVTVKSSGEEVLIEPLETLAERGAA